MAQNSHETSGASRVVGETEPPEPTRKCPPILPVTQGVERSRYAESVSRGREQVVVGIMAGL